MDVPFKISDGFITIEIKVEPRASKKLISGVSGNTLKVKLTAPPVDNSANEQLIEVLSDAFKVKKGCIKIIKGQTSKNKVVRIEGVEAVFIDDKQNR